MEGTITCIYIVCMSPVLLGEFRMETLYQKSGEDKG